MMIKVVRNLFTVMTTASLCALSCGLNTTKLLGSWHQVYSDAYVQTTSEVDWKCVEVVVEKTPASNNTLIVSKTAYLHRMPSPFFRFQPEKTTVNRTVQVMDNDILSVDDGSLLPVSWEVRTLDDSVAVLTGVELPTLYVWTRNGSTVDLMGVLDDIAEWNYVTPEKIPIPSYWEAC